MCCRNVFCIYYKEDKCILNEISLDDKRICEEMIYVNMDDGVLKKERESILEKFENY